MALSGDDKAEALISVGADGRITKWLLCGHLDAIGTVQIVQFKIPHFLLDEPGARSEFDRYNYKAHL